jgi:hypothetical protein
MKFPRTLRLSVVAASAMILNACGSDNPVSLTAATQPVVSEFTASLKSAMASVKGLSDPAFADLVDDGFVDAGYTKTQLKDSLAADATNTTGTPPAVAADSAFPLITVESVVLGTCDDATGICSVTINYINPDPDLTKTSDVVQVKVSGGKMRLYGDQQKVTTT